MIHGVIVISILIIRSKAQCDLSNRGLRKNKDILHNSSTFKGNLFHNF